MLYRRLSHSLLARRPPNDHCKNRPAPSFPNTELRPQLDTHSNHTHPPAAGQHSLCFASMAATHNANLPIYHIGLSDDSFHDPAHTGPRPTHDLPKGGTWSLYSTIEIAAPPRHVYDALIDVQEWQHWNSFITAVRITKHPKAHHRGLKMEAGTFMNMTAQITPDEALTYRAVCHYREKLKTRDDGRASHAAGGNVTRIRWTMDNANSLLPAFVLKTERVNEIIETDDPNVTRYRTWQAWGGLQARSYQKKYEAAFKGKFEDMCRDLKRQAEFLFAQEQEKARAEEAGAQ